MRSTDLGEEGELLLGRRSFAIPESRRILAGEAMVGELRPQRVALISFPNPDMKTIGFITKVIKDIGIKPQF